MLGDYLTGNHHDHFMGFFTDQIYKRKIMTFQSHTTEIMKLMTSQLSKTPQHMIEIQNILKEHFNKTSRRDLRKNEYRNSLICLHRGIIFSLMKMIR